MFCNIFLANSLNIFEKFTTFPFVEVMKLVKGYLVVECVAIFNAQASKVQENISNKLCHKKNFLKCC